MDYDEVVYYRYISLPTQLQSDSSGKEALISAIIYGHLVPLIE